MTSQLSEVTARPLTKAQQRHLQTLIEATQHAQQMVDAFVLYLRDEYDCPAPEWTIRSLNVGFEPSNQQSNE